MGGAVALVRQGTIPGPVTQTDALWPGANLLSRPQRVYTLVMTVHPECPCTRATMNELEVLMTRCQGRLNAIVVFYEPAGLAEDGLAGELWHSAAAINGVRCIDDRNGDLITRFGGRTSGQVFLYDTAGALRFNGGITSERGHAGDSDGLNAIIAIVGGSNAAPNHSPVFGCLLR